MRRFFATTLLSALILVGGLACSEDPVEPDYSNPLDPDGPGGGDPFQLTAIQQNDQIMVSWMLIEGEHISGYRLLHSLQENTGFTDTGVVPLVPTDAASPVVAFHREYSPNVANFYKVQALGIDGSSSSVSNVAAAFVLPAPWIRLESQQTTTPTRYITFQARTDDGDALEVANEADFSDAVSFDITPGEILTDSWTLPQAESNGDTLMVHVRAQMGSGTSASGKLVLTTNFSPTVTAVGGATAVMDPMVKLLPQSTGLLAWRQSASVEGLAGALWEAVADTIATEISTEIADPQEVFLEFEGDLGYNDTTSIVLTPVSEVGAVTFSIDGGAETTSSSTVTLVASVQRASSMTYSEDPSFMDAQWVAYSDTVTYFMTADEGEKTIYGRFVNPWDPDGSSGQASIILLGGPQ